MGLFSWLSGGKATRLEPDSVWLTADARLAGLRDRVGRHAEQGQVLLLAHFPLALEQLADALRGRASVEHADSEGDVARALASPRAHSVSLALVRHLPAQPPMIAGDVTTPLSILVAERHPLRAEDERVERLAGELPYECRVRFHLSLEDALLERFAGDRVNDLLARLGMAENEELTHPLISRAVERAQEQAAERATSEIEAGSVEEWLRAIEPE